VPPISFPITLPLILIAIAGLVTFILLIMALIGVSRSRPSNDPNDDPRCGACGCIIAHPKDGICPTCRSSLALVGLVLPFSKKRTTSWTGRQAFFKVTAFPLALWTLFITGLAIGGTYAIDQWALPYVWQTTSTVNARPRSSGCQSIHISTLEEYHANGRAQFETPSAIKTSRLELKTDTASHVLNVDLLAPFFSYNDSTGKLITHDRLPVKGDLIAFMQAADIPLDANSTWEAGVIATMLTNLAPSETLVISSRDPRRISKLDTTRIAFNGGQWKATIPLTNLSMSVSPAIWLLGFIFIIWKQRNRRAQVAAELLKPPLPPIAADPLANVDGDAVGGWDITPDSTTPFAPQRSVPQLATPAAFKSPGQPVTLKRT
jgi:hypothetical protein